MPAQVVVLGGGVGGTLTANLLARQLGRNLHVTVVDPTGMHVYQPGFLYAALGKANGRWLARDERTLLHRKVDLAVEAATHIDPDKGTVQLAHGGSLPFDYLVLATGARLVPEQIPGLAEGAHEFYSLQGALRLREALRGFRGGRVLVGVAGIPYKCPPAPVEFTLMLDQYLRRRGLRDKSQVTLLSPLSRAFTIESASKLIQPILTKRGIGLETFFNVEEVDPSAGTVSSLEGEAATCVLLVLVPPHRGQAVIESSGLGDVGGSATTDRQTLSHRDHARIVASRIAALVTGTAPSANYGGRVMCFLETGDGRATALRFDYEHPPVPPAPSWAWHAAKWAFNRLYWDTSPKAASRRDAGRANAPRGAQHEHSCH